MTGWDALRSNGRSMFKLGLAAGLLLLALVVALMSRPAEAKDGGLYWERQASANQVGVRRMRDTDEGVVCYVAKGPPIGGYASNAFSVAISCVKVSP